MASKALLYRRLLSVGIWTFLMTFHGLIAAEGESTMPQHQELGRRHINSHFVRGEAKSVKVGAQAAAIPDKAALYSRFRNQEVRPRMVDLLELIPDLGHPSPLFYELPREAWLRQIIVQKLPSLIAHLELAYPGGRYVFLGRDGAFLADLIDGFYLSRGEVGRVLRLDVSRETLNISPVEMYLLLRQQGFRFKAGEKPSPLVILDRTQYQFTKGNYNQSSQVMRMLATIYEAGLRLGVKAEDLLSSIGGVSLTVDSNHQVAIENYQHYFKALSISTIDFGGNIKLRGPHTIMKVDARSLIDGNQADGSGENNLWSLGFGALKVTQSGDLIADPKMPESVGLEASTWQRQVLGRAARIAEMQLGYQVVSSYEFHSSVYQIIAHENPELGRSFVASRSFPVNRSLAKQEALRGNAAATLTWLKMLEASSQSSAAKLSELESVPLPGKIESIYRNILEENKGKAWITSAYRLRRSFILYSHWLQLKETDSSAELRDQFLDLLSLDLQQLVLAGQMNESLKSLSQASLKGMEELLELSGELKETLTFELLSEQLQTNGVPPSMIKSKWKVMTVGGLAKTFGIALKRSFSNFMGMLTVGNAIVVVPELIAHTSNTQVYSQLFSLVSLSSFHLIVALGGTYFLTKGIKFTLKSVNIDKKQPHQVLVDQLTKTLKSPQILRCVQSLYSHR